VSAQFPLVAVYADESCLGNGRTSATPGGLGSLVEFRRADGVIQRFELWASEPDTTNNRMALRSVIDTFAALSRKGNRMSVRFTTDSRYIVDGMNSWVRGWIARGWRRKVGAVENVELWQAAVEAIAGHEVEWRWVRGHDGHPQNEYANHLATRAAADQNSSQGLIPSVFEEWWASRRVQAGTVPAPFEPFPEPSQFQPAPPLPSGVTTRRP
jgi:ribonuclease HI